MSRELKRVPLDFSWPVKAVWKGYLNPFYGYSMDCPDCEGGYSKEAKLLKDRWYGYVPFRPEDRGSVPFTPEHPAIIALAERNYRNGSHSVAREAMRLCEIFNAQWSHHLNADDVRALLDANRLWDFTRTPRTEEHREIVRAKLAAGRNSWLPENNGYVPTPQEVNDWSIAGFGHDSCNQWIVCKAECERNGWPTECVRCHGEGRIWISEDAKRQADEWTEIDPPSGDGFQLWENCTEGSPVSPVFATLDGLCAWCETGATTFGSATASADDWRKMLDADFVHHAEGNLVFL